MVRAKRRARRLKAATSLAAFVMAFGPFTPLALCSLGHADEIVRSTTVETHCHSAEKTSPASDPTDGGHGCCEDVDDSCCLAATDVDGKLMDGGQISAASLAPTPFLAGVQPIVAPAPLIARLLQHLPAKPPGSACILRL